MPSHFLAIDAGTTTIRALVIDGQGTVCGKASAAAKMFHPQPGLAQQDPETYWTTTLQSMRQAMANASVQPTDIAAIGIASQRTCCMLWERDTGKPLTPLVSWQDLRGLQRSQELQSQGYLLLPYAAACKLESIIASIPNAQARLENGELVWGNIDTYIAARLSGNAIHVTDRSQACTTGYFDFTTGELDQSLLSLQNIPSIAFPNLVDSYGPIGTTSQNLFGAAPPITAITGDQQAATVAHGCASRGQGKVTYGTSATVNVSTGTAIEAAPGAYPLVLTHASDESQYCVEAMVITAGAFINWMSLGLGLADSPGEIGPLAASVESSEGVRVLPALQGLGSPHADSDRTAEINGITRGTQRAHIARAGLEGIAYRVREALDAIYDGLQLPYPPTLHVDGGATACKELMQLQANVIGIPVEVLDPQEATAYGAALLAGVGIGHWKIDDIQDLRSIAQRYEPQWTQEKRDASFNEWRTSFGLTSA